MGLDDRCRLGVADVDILVEDFAHGSVILEVVGEDIQRLVYEESTVLFCLIKKSREARGEGRSWPSMVLGAEAEGLVVWRSNNEGAG